MYQAVKNWVCEAYEIEEERIIRPFWPGEDYQKRTYSPDCVVLDNPPFSILSSICGFYQEHGVQFFLFAPSLTLLSASTVCMDLNHLVCDASIVYENGARVKTSFVTNLGDGQTVMQSAPELSRRINQASKEGKKSKSLPKYQYPSHVITVATLQRYAKYGLDFSIGKKDCVLIRQLEAQKEYKKAIYGNGLLVSSQKAKEREKADRRTKKGIEEKEEKDDFIVWKLSPKEFDMIAKLDS